MSVQQSIWKSLSRFQQDEGGATSIEYALIAGLIAVGVITAVTAIGTTLSTTFSTVDSGFN